MCSDSSFISLIGMLIIVVNAYFMTSLPYRLQVLGDWGREQMGPDPIVSLALT